MSWDGKPMLADFGLSHLQESTSTFESATETESGTIRYMAKELFCEDESIKFIHTTCSDIWAFGLLGQVSHSLFVEEISLIIQW